MASMCNRPRSYLAMGVVHPQVRFLTRYATVRRKIASGAALQPFVRVLHVPHDPRPSIYMHGCSQGMADHGERGTFIVVLT
jgi:hypothetical protein